MDACLPYLHPLWPSWESMDDFFPFCRSFTSLYYINRKNRVFVNAKMKSLMIFSYSLLLIDISPECTFSLVIHKISKAGCKKRGLMQYKCMERQSRNLSMEGFHFPFCYVYREYSGRNAALGEGNKESLYTDFLLPLSGSPGAWEAKRILQNKLKQDNIKNTDTIPCSMSPHSRTTRAGLTQDFPTV